ncbi:MAG: HD domain-containing protein [Candidatus Lokiarchaeota archaeon]
MYFENLAILKRYFPKWYEIIKSNYRLNKLETGRTIEHIFRLLQIYYSLIENRIDLNISKTYCNELKEEISWISAFNSNIIPILILFHDIGRPQNKEWHTVESAEIVEKYDLLEKFNLTEIQCRILKGVIRNHLLLGTIFTGESSYTGAVSLVQDIDLISIWNSSTENISLFFKILRIFTIIDILGYSYSKIYDHYFRYYSKISNILENLFIKLKDIKNVDKLNFLYENLKELDKNNLKWRLCGSIRIFQFIDTKDYLNEEFFYTKIDNNIKSQTLRNHLPIESKLDYAHLIQFKYALGIMMILAQDQFMREPPSKTITIKKEIFEFWKICNEKVRKYYNNMKTNQYSHSLWYFVFHFPPNWYFQSNYIQYVKSRKFLNDLIKTEPVYQKNINSYIISFNPRDNNTSLNLL